MKRIIIFVMFFITLFATSAWSDGLGNCKELLPRGLEFTRNCQTIKARVNLYSAYPAFDRVNVLVTSVVTMPVGTNVSWVLDVESGVLNVEPDPNSALAKAPKNKWDHGHKNAVKPLVIKYLGQIGNYAVVPNTMGIDGNPLEILVIGGPLLRGSVTPVKLIGALSLSLFDDPNHQAIEHKLLAVLPGTPLAALLDGVNILDEANSSAIVGLKSIIQTWFQNYAGPNSYVADFLPLGDTGDGGLDGTAYGILNDANIGP